MAKEPNMKVRATMDNSDLKKKSQESKAALRDFEKAGTDAVSKLGEAFGVNTGKLEQMLSSVQGLGFKLTESGNAGVAAFGKMLTGINGLTAGIAGLGLGAALATFKLLSSEAENFKNTVAGANMELATQAYIDTYRQVIHDFNKDLGKGFAEAESGWKKFWGTIGSAMKAGITTGAIGAAPGDFQNQGFVNYAELTDKAAAAARTAEEISNDIYETTRKISNASVEWARQEREIAEYKRIAYDSTVSTAERQEALNKAVELINKRYQEEAELRKRLADLQAEMNSLAESSVADVDKANQLRIQAEQVTAKLNNALRELSEKQKTITDLAKKEADERAKALAAAQQLAQLQADAKSVQGQLESFAQSTQMTGIEQVFEKLPLPDALPAPSKMKIPIEKWWATVTKGSEKFGKIHIALDPDDFLEIREGMQDISAEVESILTSSFENIGVSIGNLIGDLATGEDAWSNFTNSAISAFGDMAITIGKMAVSTGTATLGIKAALESLNGYVAIAAGVALIALGAAVKTGLSNVASGNYNASTNVASSVGSYGSHAINMGFESREIIINVSGELRADGSQLLAVINNENKRQIVTT